MSTNDREVWALLTSACENSTTIPNTDPIPVKGKLFAIGRAKDCDLQLPLKLLSSHHCYLRQDNDRSTWLCDTSLNGTFINKKIKVSNGECYEIHDGDLLYLIHKKRNPNKDFCLIFHTKKEEITENNPDFPAIASSSAITVPPPQVTLNSTNEPEIKRRKLEHETKQIIIKQEPAMDEDKDDVSTIDLNFGAGNDLATRIRTDFPEDGVAADAERTSNEGTESILNEAESSFDHNEVTVKQEREETVPVASKVGNSIELETGPALPLVSQNNDTEVTMNSDVGNLIKSETGPAIPLVSQNSDTKVSLGDVSSVPANSTSMHKQKSQVEDKIADILQCSLCLEILYDPICLQPCMHCYCAACYSQWMDESQACPQCRSTVDRLSRNHLIGSLVDAYLKDHPEKRRSLSDIARMDELNNITDNLVQVNKSPDSSTNSGDLSLAVPVWNPHSLAGVVSLQIPHRIPLGPLYPSCRQCPQNQANRANKKRTRGGKKKNDASQEEATTSQAVNAGASGSTTNISHVTEFVCPPGQPHVVCACCFQSMPDRHNVADCPPQQCSICKQFHCHLYWRCQKQGCTGCLNKFADMNFTEDSLSDIINKNKVETRILFDYLKSQHKNSHSLLEECMERLDDRTYSCTLDLTSTSILCYSCALRNICPLAYYYRRDIPQTLLTEATRERTDCYWGRNCRTQSHNIAHAERYNHICEQTRF